MGALFFCPNPSRQQAQRLGWYTDARTPIIRKSPTTGRPIHLDLKREEKPRFLLNTANTV